MIVVYSHSAERGIRMLNIVPSGLKSWNPFDVDISGSLNINIEWTETNLAGCSFQISKHEREAITSHKYLVVLVREQEVELLSGDDPDSAVALQVARLKIVTDKNKGR